MFSSCTHTDNPYFSVGFYLLSAIRVWNCWAKKSWYKTVGQLSPNGA